MPKLSVIVPVCNNAETLDKALDSLIHQTSEDFEVIIVDEGSDDNSEKIAREYCEAYVDFYYIKQEKSGRFSALNRGIDAAVGDYIMFCDPDGFITDSSVEAIIESIGEEKIDLVCFRTWEFGANIISRYNVPADVLAILPSINISEKSLCYSFELCNKVFRRAIINSRNIRFTEHLYADMLFVYKMFLASQRIIGCPKAVYERRIYTIKPNEASINSFVSTKRLDAYIEAWDIIEAQAEEYILSKSGQIDGDESFLQEIYYACVKGMIDKFYYHFWYYDDEFLSKFIEYYNIRAGRLVKEKLETLKSSYRHLSLPFIYKSHCDAAAEPVFSFLIDLPYESDHTELFESLYAQSMPFFEVFVKSSVKDADKIPTSIIKCDNIYIIDDKGFYSEARKRARSKITINIRDNRSLNEDVVKETYLTPVPLFMKAYTFSQKKNSLSLKRSLKEKGLNMG